MRGDPAEQGVVRERGWVESCGDRRGEGMSVEDVADGFEGDGALVVVLEVGLIAVPRIVGDRSLQDSQRA